MDCKFLLLAGAVVFHFLPSFSDVEAAALKEPSKFAIRVCECYCAEKSPSPRGGGNYSCSDDFFVIPKAGAACQSEPCFCEDGTSGDTYCSQRFIEPESVLNKSSNPKSFR